MQRRLWPNQSVRVDYKNFERVHTFLNVIVAKCVIVFEVPSRINYTLLIRRNTERRVEDIGSVGDVQELLFFVLNPGFDIVDSVQGLDFKCDGITDEAKITRSQSSFQDHVRLRTS
jgi:hypothetical protein